jgi:hypothetical protein
MSMTPQLSLFLRISSCLTGFEVTELEATGMTEKYLSVVEKEAPAETLAQFFKESEAILQAGEENPAAINPSIAANLFPPSCFGGLAQNIVLMWYFGQWNPQVEAAKSLQTAQNISPNAYVQGLVWAVADTHPPGAKQPGYGSWALPPLSRQ